MESPVLPAGKALKYSRSAQKKLDIEDLDRKIAELWGTVNENPGNRDDVNFKNMNDLKHVKRPENLRSRSEGYGTGTQRVIVTEISSSRRQSSEDIGKKKVSPVPLSESQIKEWSMKECPEVISATCTNTPLKSSSQCDLDSLNKKSSSTSSISSNFRKSTKPKSRRRKKNLETEIERTIRSQFDQNFGQSSDNDDFSVASNMTSDDILNDVSDIEDEIISNGSKISSSGRKYRRESSTNRKIKSVKVRQTLQNTPASPIAEAVSDDEASYTNGGEIIKSDHLEDLVKVLSKRKQKVTDSFGKESLPQHSDNPSPNQNKTIITSEDFVVKNLDSFFSSKENWNINNKKTFTRSEDPFYIDQDNSSISSNSSYHNSSSQALWGDLFPGTDLNPFDSQNRTDPELIFPKFEAIEKANTKDSNQTQSVTKADTKTAKIAHNKNDSLHKTLPVDEDREMKTSNRKIGVTLKSLLKRSSSHPTSEHGAKESQSVFSSRRQIKPFHKKTISQPLLVSSSSPYQCEWEPFGSDTSPWGSDTFKANATNQSNDSSKNSKDKLRLSKSPIRREQTESLGIKQKIASTQSNLNESQSFTPSPRNMNNNHEDAGSVIKPRILFGEHSSIRSGATSGSGNLSPNDVKVTKHETCNKSLSINKVTSNPVDLYDAWNIESNSKGFWPT